MDLLRQTALSYINVSYRWGGDDPILGYDCSGLAQEILASAGEDPPGDQTAQGLFDWFNSQGRGRFDAWGLGALVFFGESYKKITHIGFCLDDHRMLEAGGGGSKVKTKEDAAQHNAYVRVRLIKRRGDRIAVIKPHYSKIGYIGR